MPLIFLLCLQSNVLPVYAVPMVPRGDGKLPPVTSRIHVDQFGYLPDEAKVAVISDPKVGYNNFDHYTPPSQLSLRDAKTGKDVLIGAVKAWNNGTTSEIHGDRGWWFDFSTVKTPGEYYVYDAASGKRSPTVRIGEKPYADVLKAAVRTYYYQREDIDLVEPYAEKPWIDKAALLMDRKARNVLAKDDAKQERDLRGGWMDAGDTNKYPPFNGDVVHPLLYAYRANPDVFGDNWSIPESGNKLPDLLDELKFQMDWLVRMQFEDGSLPVKMGDIDYNGKWPLSDDTRTRYYGPKDSGATIYATAMYAHASRVYGKFPAWKGYAEDLAKRAVRAWDWYKKNPRTYNSDSNEIKSGNANKNADDQDRMEAFAAIHLFALTDQSKYNEVVKEKAGKTRQLSEWVWSPYEAGAAEALVDYLSLKGADAGLKQKIVDKLNQTAKDASLEPTNDLYRAWMVPTSYHWGSNFVRAGYGIVALLAGEHGNVDATLKAKMKQRAADMLHSFHGMNPFNAVYLTNMERYGAALSMRTIYHGRWGDGTPFAKNPPPGYVVGGPNKQYGGKAADNRPSTEWIKSQPAGKSYADFNIAWPEASWELSENANYYQAMYIRLLAAFAR